MHRSAPARRTTRRPPGLVLVTTAAVVAVLVGSIGYRASTSSSPGTSSLGEADGVIPEDVVVSVFDVETPAVGKLDPDLLAALHLAAAGAAADDVELQVTSGWRSPEYQARLLQDAIAEHGSLEEAARWVATPGTSPHVAGDAVDLGPSHARPWLARHGAGYGLCQTYANEPWHYELRPRAVADGCPPMYADPTEDPRMQP